MTSEIRHSRRNSARWLPWWWSKQRFLEKNDLKTVNKRAFPKFNIMGTGASTSNREWTAADEDNATVEDVRPRTAANANLPANDSITGMTKVVEAKNRFLKIKNKEKNTACFQKQVRNWICYICLWNNYMKSTWIIVFAVHLLQAFHSFYGAIEKNTLDSLDFL